MKKYVKGPLTFKMKLLVMKNYLSFDLSLWLNCQIAAFHMQATLVRVATTIFSVATLSPMVTTLFQH